MKFMKLGSKPDVFQADGKSTRYVLTELATDIIINVGEVKFYLHKFPLLSKSNCLQKLVSEASEENSDEIDIVDFPGGPKAFEICAKFCYGMTVTLNAYNVVATRCAAEYLEMTEDVDRGNLIFKVEVFLNSSIFHSWKDSIIVLQTTKSLIPWSEDLKIVERCIDAIAFKIYVDPAKVSWSYTHNRKLAEPDNIVEDGKEFHGKVESVPKDWWVEDVCDLEIDLYKRVMVAVKSKGRMDGTIIGEALKTYAVRWLPDTVDALVSEAHTWIYKSLVETIIYLLPSEKTRSCSCSFLLKLLKVSTLVRADESLTEDLVKMIGLKLHEARVTDLLFRARSPQSTMHDIELVQSLVDQYMMQAKLKWDLDSAGKNENGTDKLMLGHGSLLVVGKLIDGYLAEVAGDPNLSHSSFIEMSKSIPDSARPTHDGLYKAIDIYLKEHPNLTKADKKQICGLMDVKKLTLDASVHAAQNERLPLRVVVQVLFFEQIRAQAASCTANDHSRVASNSATNTDEECENPAALLDCKTVDNKMSKMKVNKEYPKNEKLAKKKSKNSRSGAQLLPSRSRRIFDKLWGMSKGQGETKSSETSGSSQSPTSLAPGDIKSSSSSSRQRRHSIS